MVQGDVVCSVWTAGGGVSFSIVGCRRAGVDLVVVVGSLVAAAGWHSPAEGAGCLLLSVLFLYLLVGRLARHELGPSRLTFSKVEIG